MHELKVTKEQFGVKIGYIISEEFFARVQQYVLNIMENDGAEYLTEDEAYKQIITIFIGIERNRQIGIFHLILQSWDI